MPGRAPNSRPTLKTPLFEMPWEMVVILATMALIMFALTRTAKAELPDPTPTPSVKKHTTTIIEKDETAAIDEGDTSVNPEREKEKTLTAKFGSKATTGMSGCKTEELAQKAIRELKTDCNAWLKDRKADLKGKYLTGSCEESCDDCGSHLQRCNVSGTVRYTTGTVK